MCIAELAKTAECDLYVTLKFAGYARGRKKLATRSLKETCEPLNRAQIASDSGASVETES